MVHSKCKNRIRCDLCFVWVDFRRYCWNLHDCNNYAVRRVVTEVCKNPKACYRYNIKLNLSMNRRFGEPRPFTLTGMPGRTECPLPPGLGRANRRKGTGRRTACMPRFGADPVLFPHKKEETRLCVSLLFGFKYASARPLSHRTFRPGRMHRWESRHSPAAAARPETMRINRANSRRTAPFRCRGSAPQGTR